MNIHDIIFPIMVIITSLVALIGYLFDWARWVNFVWFGLGYGFGACVIKIMEGYR